jgi:UDP-N-acetylglucosamine--N-acetylmuramyl-(pentapeptide) pyrophosphoryl-undecaprenol N-acetylglucosamine transferase
MRVSEAMRILVSGGGTAGHIYPALEVARLLAREPDGSVAFVGAPGSLEERLAGEAGLRFVPVRAQGWDRARPLSLVTAVLTTLGSVARCMSLLRRERIDAVCGFGGYVSLPLGVAAVLVRVPLVIHEQNAVPGLANRALARWARAVCLTYPDSASGLRRGARTVVTGNPVRGSVLEADRVGGRATFGVAAAETLLLVFGGSRGARHLNSATVNLYSRLREIQGVRVVQIAGPSEAGSVGAQLAEAAGGNAPEWWAVREYVDGMGDLIAAADLVVCRAGATTLAELSVLAKPMVLVPYPYATDDHQTHNAEPFLKAGGGAVIADAALDGPEFADTVLGLLRDPEARARMGASAATLGRPQAAEAVLAAVRDAADGARGPAVRDDDLQDGKGGS